MTGIDTSSICKHDVERKESGISPDVNADLKSLFSEGTLSDMQIRTSTEMFPVHSQILGARSPVFRAMFSTDMKERTKECVDITDLDSETVRRMILVHVHGCPRRRPPVPKCLPTVRCNRQVRPPVSEEQVLFNLGEHY
ncbi:TD and POZ domain-containing protein 5 [Caerostris extrusa]|uniref:TD and POZ domain-containing protein 5 n=1 Tax=Caerostris extrusa TaxID=172846 RepID=A0AAV4SZQ4_CAEEX|nr:TD and POZ domain-containing protein 5 [Caerostris extrusa]